MIKKSIHETHKIPLTWIVWRWTDGRGSYPVEMLNQIPTLLHFYYLTLVWDEQRAGYFFPLMSVLDTFACLHSDLLTVIKRQGVSLVAVPCRCTDRLVQLSSVWSLKLLSHKPIRLSPSPSQEMSNSPVRKSFNLDLRWSNDQQTNATYLL